MNKSEEKVLHIVMFPWLAMGHLLPFLHISKLLARKNHKISFISTQKNIDRFPKLPQNLSSSINFISLPLPSFPGLPSTSESSMDLPYIKQHSLKCAFDLLQTPLKEFLQKSSPDLIIYDYASHWLPKIASELEIRKVFFSIFNAATLSFFGPPLTLIKDSRSSPEDFTKVPPWIPFESKIAFRYHEIVSYVEKTEEDEVTGISDLARFGYSIGESDAVIVRSSPEFEPEWFGLLRELYQKPVLPTGFLPLVFEEASDDNATWRYIKEWLDKQEVESVVYVAMGTEASFRREDIIELALGLENSKVPFFWVLRKAEPELPDGFEERVKGRGIVHVGWAPQVNILSHSSVGGFLTHCGWSSLIEGLGLGRVPILMPVVNEQGLNVRLLQGKGLGVEILRDEKDGSFDRNSVADSVRLAMIDEVGESIRRKAKEMKSLFGDKDKNIRYEDDLVSYFESNKSFRD